MKLYTEDGREAGLKDVMMWFVETYPDDIFVSNFPVHNFRDWCKEQLRKIDQEKEQEKEKTLDNFGGE